jgi:hypothetical protein
MSVLTKKEPRLRFATLETEADVGDALGLGIQLLQQFRDEIFKVRLYSPINLPKKGRLRKGEVRTVYEVVRGLRRVHLEIMESLNLVAEISPRAYGFVRGRSALDNARVHHNSEWLLNIDLNDFFGSVREPAVDAAFRALGCGPSASATLASLCCLRGSLPQGAATSPILSNIVCRNLDARLDTLSSSTSSRYTRYADDITFSGHYVPTVEQIRLIVEELGFSINTRKVKLAKRGGAQYVTGFSVGGVTGVRLPARVRRYLRLQFHLLHKDNPSEDVCIEDRQLMGLVVYAVHVEPAWVINQMRKFRISRPEGWDMPDESP